MNTFSIIQLPELSDSRGCLGFAESGAHVPFLIERIFYIYNVKPGETRGAHAHHAGKQFLISLAGKFDVDIDNGTSISSVSLASSSTGLYIPQKHWLNLRNFTPDAICLVLASNKFDESDYIRNYNKFKELSNI